MSNELQKQKRRLRRIHTYKKQNRLLNIIQTGGYAPHRGYIDWGFTGKTLLHSGKHIKYPKNSEKQKWIKTETSRRLRHYKHIPKKGNTYRKLFDYWWEMY